MVTVIEVGGKKFNPGPFLRAVTQEQNGTSIVSSSRSGMLICREDKSAWCSHISTVMTAGADAKVIFKDYFTNGVDNVIVPLVPTFSVFVTVRLAPTKTDEFLKVHLQAPADSVRDKDHDTFLGLLSEIEGRIEIRRMLIDWIDPIASKKLPPTRCTSMKHNFAREASVRASFRDGGTDTRKVIAHAWCLVWYRKCVECFADEGPGTAWDPDLIPT